MHQCDHTITYAWKHGYMYVYIDTTIITPAVIKQKLWSNTRFCIFRWWPFWYWPQTGNSSLNLFDGIYFWSCGGLRNKNTTIITLAMIKQNLWSNTRFCIFRWWPFRYWPQTGNSSLNLFDGIYFWSCGGLRNKKNFVLDCLIWFDLFQWNGAVKIHYHNNQGNHTGLHG